MIAVHGIVVGGGDDGTYVVDATTCAHTTDGVHHCIHDWRIHWGNVDRTDV